MGCAQSKIENEESVARCKERRQFMKEAVVSRNAFAAAHVSYIMSLKNTGAALSEYGQAEMVGLHNNHHSTTTSSATTTAVASSSVAQTPMDNLPPPPPLPVFSPSPLRRAATMPVNSAMRPFSDDLNSTMSNIPVQEGEAGGGGLTENVEQKNQPPPPPPPPVNKGMTWDYFFSMEDDINAVSNMAEEEIAPNIHHVVEKEVEEETPPVTPQKMTINAPLSPPASHQPTSIQQSAGSTVHLQHASSTGVLEIKRGEDGIGGGGAFVDLLRILNDIDDHFLKGSESAQDVSKMLEATRLHYHSNFADNRGHIDHSARVMRVITWNRSFKGIPYGENNSKDDFDNDKWETHATILDKLLAWEKKLYDEVKAGELMKIEYQRKVGLLSKQKKRGANPETLEKTKAAVSHLHTRYIVDMQSMDSTVSEIQHLRDQQLYPKLSSLVNAMAQMWETMHINHDKQLKVVLVLRSLNISATQMETTQQHYNKTAQLHQMAMEWHSSFQKLVNHHKEYIQALNSWLKLNVIPIESSLKEKVSSPPHLIQPPIQPLLHAWQDQLEKLPEELAKTAIHSFAAVINSIMLHQQEEMKHRDKCDEMNKDYVRKKKAYDDWVSKYGVANHHHQQQQMESEEVVQQGGDEYVNNPKDSLLEEKKLVVETLKKRVDEENEGYRMMCKHVREKSVMSLKTHLPELFRAMSDFSLASFTMYKNLRDIITKNVNH